MALGRKTGGRQKGTPNRRTQALLAAADDLRAQIGAASDAHGLLIAVYSNEALPIDLRVDAAGKALPYEKPRLQSVTLAGDKDKPLQLISRIELVPLEPLKKDDGAAD